VVSPLIAAVVAMVIIGGLFLVAAGLRRHVPAGPSGAGPFPSSSTLRRLVGWQRRWTRRTRILLGVGLAVGFAAAVATGWVVAIPLGPVVFAGVPALLSSGGERDVIARLEAMEGWVRSLGNALASGVGLEQAIRRSLKSCPDAIRPEVTTLVGRLHDWPTSQALRAFADDLDDATGDLIVSSLLLGADRRGRGLTPILDGLAASVAEDVRIRRSIEADRAKPRAIARYVTIFALVLLGGLALFSRSYVEPYGSALGQPILAVLLAAFAAALVWLKRMAHGEPTPRFLTASAPGRGGRS
jgi:Flp pilus assembly protein TadB